MTFSALHVYHGERFDSHYALDSTLERNSNTLSVASASRDHDGGYAITMVLFERILVGNDFSYRSTKAAAAAIVDRQRRADTDLSCWRVLGEA